MKTITSVVVIVVALASLAIQLGYLDLSGPTTKPEPVATLDHTIIPEPVIVEESKPLPVEEPESVPVKERESVPAEEAEPVPVDEAEPVPVDEAEPVPVDEAEPVPVDAPKTEEELQPSEPTPPDQVVAELHAKYKVALASQAMQPFDEAKERLAAGYLKALDREEKKAQEAADLDAMLHWRNEKMSVQKKPNAGEPRESAPEKLLEVKRIYEVELEKLVAVREEKEAELKAKYDEALAGYVKRLTQSRKIDEALAVEKWRDPYRVSEQKPSEQALAVASASPRGLGVVASGDRLTMMEIDQGEVGSELEIILPGGLPMVFCWCPPGKFLMGSPPDEEGREVPSADGSVDEETQHLVELTKGFWLGKFEVTQSQWTALMETTVEEQHSLVPQRFDKMFMLGPIGPEIPMYFVSYDESELFCEKLARKVRPPSQWSFVLPTEAQWEYACRAGTTGPYGGTGVLSDMGQIGERVLVGQKKPNDWGLHDMHGNVGEWCASWYEKYPKGPQINPKGPKYGTARVIRGQPSQYSSRSAYRYKRKPGMRVNTTGFRVALSNDR